MGKRVLFPDPWPLAYLRAGPVSSARVDEVATRLRELQKNKWAKDALHLIQDLAAYALSTENELGRVYEERKKVCAH